MFWVNVKMNRLFPRLLVPLKTYPLPADKHWTLNAAGHASSQKQKSYHAGILSIRLEQAITEYHADKPSSEPFLKKQDWHHVLEERAANHYRVVVPRESKPYVEFYRLQGKVKPWLFRNFFGLNKIPPKQG